MNNLRWILIAAICIGFLFCGGSTEEPEANEMTAQQPPQLTAKEQLGKILFFDTNLSSPPGQSCATCHGPAVSFTGPDSKTNETTVVYLGALEPRFGNRKPPTAAYAGASPKLHRDEEGTFVGGMFWDGRATGWELGDPLTEQAMGPFLNPLEMNMPDDKAVVQKVLESDYVDLFEEVWGAGSLTMDDVKGTYERIARALAAYERSAEVNPFNSKFDDFWRKTRAAGLDLEAMTEENWETYKGYGLDDDEVQGLMLFHTQGLCSQCHVLTSENGNPPLFTDFTYDNLGAPPNPDNPFYVQEKEFNPDGNSWVDKGLGAFLEGVEEYRQYAQENMGKYKVPTLRNVDRRPTPDFVKAFFHNGVFKSLKEVVSFYNTRDVEGAGWAEPEIDSNVNTEEMGDLKLTETEEDLVVLFMKTLSDR